MNEGIVKVSDLYKSYVIDGNEDHVLTGLSLELHEKEFLCVLGHTGCGKSTLLRIVAGFERADAGFVEINNVRHMRPTKDAVMIFQDYNQLFPWKSAVENVLYPAVRTGAGLKRKDAYGLAMDLLHKVGLEGFEHHYPHQLSGGMRQRVAVARALIVHPKLLLMDEPFAALDEITRAKLQAMCNQILYDEGITVLFVTHSIEEAIVLSDRIVIMGRVPGNIAQSIDNKDKGDAADVQYRLKMRKKIIETMNTLR